MNLITLPRPRVLVLGDLMLDKYAEGLITRTSVEAPVPIVSVQHEWEQPGGAAAVAMLLAGLNCHVTLCGVTSFDHAGCRLKDLLEEAGVDCELLGNDRTRPTTVKERVRASAPGGQMAHMVRLDRESHKPVGEDVLPDDLIRDAIQETDAVVISDYGKGICTRTRVQRIMFWALQQRVPVIVDPSSGGSWEKYGGATVLKPNRVEAAACLGWSVQQVLAEPEKAARQLMCCIDAAVLLTLDGAGAVLAERDTTVTSFPAIHRDVVDIAGAGDTVIALVSLCLGSGVTLRESVPGAMAAAGLQVGQPGVAPVSRVEVQEMLDEYLPAKILPLAEATRLRERWREQGQRVAVVNGVFDLLHPGHLFLLNSARRFGDKLVVLVNSDRSVKELRKGVGRPCLHAAARAEVLAALDVVDHVVVFDGDGPHKELEALRPDVYVRGYDQRDAEEEGIVTRAGGEVERIPRGPDISTTSLVTQMCQ